MPGRQTCALVAALLTAGFVLGAIFGTTGTNGLLHAGPQEATAEQRELELGRTTLMAGGKLLAEVASRTTPSVVHIQSERRSREEGLLEETGSGVVVRSDQAAGLYVVTNRHVVRGAELEHIAIHLADGRVVRPLRLWSDKATDVAVLRLPVDDVRPAPWATGNAAHIGQMVLAMGSPFGLSQSVTLGIISARGRRSLRLGEDSEVINQDFLQTDAAINPGNSGGPLIDLEGRIVGINTAIASNGGGNEGIGFSIPAHLAHRVVQELLKNGHVQRAFLGVKLDPLFDDAMANRLELERVRGARVTQVYPNTPASRAGLRFNDVVLSFNGTDVLDQNHLINLVSLTPVDSRVAVELWRDGHRGSVPVVLTDRTDLESRTDGGNRPGNGVDVTEIGLVLHPLDGETAGQLGFDRSLQGLLVLRIDDRSPLVGSVKLYDVVEKIAGVPVATVADVRDVLRNRQGSLNVQLARRESGRTIRESLVLRR